MGLRTKFNLTLFAVAFVGITASGYVSYHLLQQNAREEILQTAGIILASAKANRSYTIEEIRPLIKELGKDFAPQMVPAYSAHANIRHLHKQYPDYSYKEATLNPTNPGSRATDWEVDIIEEFQNDDNKKQIIGEHGGQQPFLYLARPIKISKQSCLTCHGKVSDAPKSMLAIYGNANGFGWQLNQVVGAQIVKVPMSLPLQRADREFKTFMLSMIIIFIFTVIFLNLLLNAIVIRPIRKMAKNAEEISLGNLDATEFTAKGNDEIASLSESLSRMRRSLVSAMKMIDE